MIIDVLCCFKIKFAQKKGSQRFRPEGFLKKFICVAIHQMCPNGSITPPRRSPSTKAVRRVLYNRPLLPSKDNRIGPVDSQTIGWHDGRGNNSGEKG